MRDNELPLHLKYRPQTLEEFVGNESTLESLKTVIERTSGEVRAFMFTGPYGCGKTSLARIVAKELGCNESYFFEYNNANTRGVDTIREITANCRYAPLVGNVKIYLLDEAHRLTRDSLEALLKLLEDTPKHVRFILCTTDPDKIIVGVKQRCSIYQVGLLKRSKILKILKWVLKEEQVEVNDSILNKITEFCGGSPRQALVMLDQVIDIADENVALQVILDSTISEDNLRDLIQKLLQVGTTWKSISAILKNIDDDPEKVRMAILNYLSKVLLDSPSDRVAGIMNLFVENWFYSGKSGMILSCFLATKVKN